VIFFSEYHLTYHFQVANLDTEESKAAFLSLYGLEENGLSKIIVAARRLLGLQSFYTVSEKGIKLYSMTALKLIMERN
jgi:ribosome-binding ATPase